MQYLAAQSVFSALKYPELIEAMIQSHRSESPLSDVLVQSDPGGRDNYFVTLASWSRDDIIATKLVGIFPGNLDLQPAQPSVQGLVAVFDARTGAPRFVADGAAMTFRKTAGDSGMGSRLLARKDAKTLLVVGAGGLASHMIEAHRCARPSIDHVLIWNRTASRAQALADALKSQLNIHAVTDLDSAVTQADIISCVTMSDQPLVKGQFLKRGVHLDLVGGYQPSLREADSTAMSRGTVFVDTRHNMENAGDLAQAVSEGAISWEDVVADAFDLCQARHGGRRSEDEITIFKNVGGGHLDLFTARHLLSKLTGQ